MPIKLLCSAALWSWALNEYSLSPEANLTSCYTCSNFIFSGWLTSCWFLRECGLRKSSWFLNFSDRPRGWLSYSSCGAGNRFCGRLNRRGRHRFCGVHRLCCENRLYRRNGRCRLWFGCGFSRWFSGDSGDRRTGYRHVMATLYTDHVVEAKWREICLFRMEAYQTFCDVAGHFLEIAEREK